MFFIGLDSRMVISLKPIGGMLSLRRWVNDMLNVR